jgi:hypothetical protein
VEKITIRTIRIKSDMKINRRRMKASKNSTVKINSNKTNNNQKTENQIWQTIKLKKNEIEKKSYKLFKIKQIVTKEHVSNMNKKQIEGVLWDFTRVSVRIEDEKEKKKATNTKQEVHWSHASSRSWRASRKIQMLPLKLTFCRWPTSYVTVE